MAHLLQLSPNDTAASIYLQAGINSSDFAELVVDYTAPQGGKCEIVTTASLSSDSPVMPCQQSTTTMTIQYSDFFDNESDIEG